MERLYENMQIGFLLKAFPNCLFCGSSMCVSGSVITIPTLSPPPPLAAPIAYERSWARNRSWAAAATKSQPGNLTHWAGPGILSCCRSNSSCCTDNTGSLTWCTSVGATLYPAIKLLSTTLRVMLLNLPFPKKQDLQTLGFLHELK